MTHRLRSRPSPKRRAKITALYHQVEARDPNDADMVSRTQRLLAQCKSTFQIVLTASGVNAIEANEKRVSIRMFPTRMSARKWVLERLDHLAALEHAAIRDRMFAL